MRVPTYTSQSAIPRQTAAMPINAQLSASAMSAPARAYAAAGSNLVKGGRAIYDLGRAGADFADKRAEIGADNEASEATVNLNIDLGKLQQTTLQNNNVANANKIYAEKSKLLVEKYKAKMSGTRARDSFVKRSRQLTTNYRVQFNKQNNARAVEQREVNLDADTQAAVANIGDLSKSIGHRLITFSDQLKLINSAEGDFGPKKTQEKRDKFLSGVAGEILIKSLAAGADPDKTLNNFVQNKSTDPLLNRVGEDIPQSERNKIATQTARAFRTENKEQTKQHRRERETFKIKFEEDITNLLRTFKAEKDMANDETAEQFTEQLDTFQQNALDSHQGTEDSKAELSLELKKLRQQQVIKFGNVQLEARKQKAKGVINADLRACVTMVGRNPSELESCIKTTNESVNKSAAKFYNTEEEQAARLAGTATLIETALESYIMRGQTVEARKLFETQGIAEQLEDKDQKKYLKLFGQYDEKQNKDLEDISSARRRYELVHGVPPTPKQLAAMLKMRPLIDTKGETGLRKEFQKVSKTYNEVRGSFDRVQASLKRSLEVEDRGAADIALIFAYMKMLDPGSVVREGEFKTAADTGGQWQAALARYNKVRTGEFLSEIQRADFANKAKDLMEAVEERYKEQKRFYRDIAKDYGYSLNRIMPDGSENENQDAAGTGDADANAQAQKPDSVIKLDATGKVIQ